MITNYFLEDLKTHEKAHIGLWSAGRFTFRATRRAMTFYPSSADEWVQKIAQDRYRIVDEYGETMSADAFFAMIGYVPAAQRPQSHRPDLSRVTANRPQFFDGAGFRFLACEFG